MLPKFPNISLTLEQEFDLRKFQDMMNDLSRLEIEELLLMSIRQKMVHENVSRSLIQEMIKRDLANVQISFSHA